MNILDTIIAHKRTAVENDRQRVPVQQLERSPWFGRKTMSLKASLLT